MRSRPHRAEMRWMRFEYRGQVSFGTLQDDDTIARFEGDMFGERRPTGETIPVVALTVLQPSVPTKMIALWNNFGALREKLNLAVPEHPLYFIKANSALSASGQPIRQPEAYDGRVVFEAELGIVIGSRCANVGEAEAAQAIFGYTCINDVTAFDLLDSDPSFQQWTRAKSFDTFGPFGPVVATELNPEELVVRALLDGQERQAYPVSDMTFKPARLVSLLSRDMTLMPGDVIACGTSVGAGRMKPGSTLVVEIAGIGSLTNRLADTATS